MGEGVTNPSDNTAIATALATVAANVLLLMEDVDSVRAKTDAMGVLTETGGTLTTDGTEQTVYINNAPTGVYIPRWLNLNFTNHTATETVVIKTYHRNVSGGAWVRDDTLTTVGVPTELLVWVKLHPTRFGCRVTIEKTAGTNRAYVWEVFYEV